MDLLSSSNTFEDPNLIDHIHQWVINLETLQKNDMQKLLNESILYLDNDLDLKTANEVISLIVTNFLYDINQPDAFFKDLIDKSNTNSNRIILTASILSYLKLLNPEKEDIITSAQPFITQSLAQILSQVKKPENEELIIFERQIPLQFQANFIVDILLLATLDKDTVTQLYPYLFAHKNIEKDKMKKLISKISKEQLITVFPESIFTDKDNFSRFSMKSLADIIPSISEKTFSQILPLIEKEYSKKKVWDRPFILSIIQKLIKCKMSFTLTENVLNSLSSADMKPVLWKYFASIDVTLPETIASKIKKFPIPSFALKIMPQPADLPEDILKRGLLEAPDFQTYKKVLSFETIRKNEAISTPKFWAHLATVASSTEKEEDEKIRKDLMRQLSELFMNHIKKENMLEAFDAMIHARFPSTNQGNVFIFDLLSKLDYSYRNFFNGSSQIIFEKVIEKKVLPLPSFWLLFDFSYLKDYPGIQNPISLYAFEFSNNRFSSLKMEKVTILPQTEKSSEQLIKFINQKETDYIVNMNDEALSLIASAFIFVSNKEKPTVQGLSSQNVLPFFAVALNYLDESRNNALFDSPEISGYLIEACKSLSSDLSKASIDSILSNSSLFSNPKIFPIKNSSKMFSHLMHSLMKNTYEANVGILISFIFKISEENPTNEFTSNIFNAYGTRFIKIIINNFSSISTDEYKNIKLNMDLFNAEQLKELLIAIVQESQSISAIISTIYLLEMHSINPPKFEITNSSNLTRALHEAINRRKWSDVLLIANFLKKHNFGKEIRKFRQISFPAAVKDELFSDYVNDEGIINKILSDPQPEKNAELLEQLFDLLMNDKSTKTDFITILLEKLSGSRSIGPKYILENFWSQIQKYGDDFINTLKKFFTFHPEEERFIRNSDFESITTPLSESGLLIIAKLMNEAKKKPINYKAFYCLKSIASSFPFLFTQEPIKVFTFVLPYLDYFSLYFTIEKEEEKESIENLKASLAALSFLHSTLYSVKVLSAFVPWLYQNILSFSPSQIIAITIVLDSLFRSKKVKKALMAISLKFHFLEIVIQLLRKEVPEEIIDAYKNSIINLLNSYYKYFIGISRSKALHIKEMHKLDDPFNYVFDNFSTVYPKGLQTLDIPSSNIKEISNFLKNINDKKTFWLIYSNTRYPSSDQVKAFMNDYKRLEPNVPDLSDLPELPSNYISNDIKSFRYLATHHYYIYQWFIRYDRFPMLRDHAITMTTAYKEIKSGSILAEGEKNLGEYDINVVDYLHDESQENLFNELIQESTFIGEKALESLDKLMKTISKKEVFLQSILSIINENISAKRNENNSLKNMQKLTRFIYSMSENDEFKDILIKTCGSNLVDICISPEFRRDETLLSNVSKVLYLIPKNLPKRVIHIIGFMLILNNQQIIPEAIRLCEKFTDDQLNCISKEIQKVFNREFATKEKSFLALNLFFERFPALAKTKVSKLYGLLHTLVAQYRDSGYSDNNLRNFICSAFTIAAPERPKDQDILSVGLDEIDYTSSTVAMTVNPLKKTTLEAPTMLIKQAPISLYNTDTKFWELFEESRQVLNDIIQNNNEMLEKLKFLLDYPELLRFFARQRYFRDKMSKRIGGRGNFSLDVDRKNLLESTFKQMNKKTTEDWLCSVHINFDNEDGIDAGGLTSEWFTLIVKEILDPKNKLFRQLDNKTSQPDPLSSTKENFADYFRFAGKIIARSLIQNHCVNAHLTRSFCRQILHRQVKLKDLEDFDENIYQSMQSVLENDVEPLDLNFTVDIVENGEYKNILLKENGEDLTVTNENKREYVSLYVNYHLRKSILQQITAFSEGFDSLIPYEDMRIFSPGELDLLICGIPEIDLNDLRNNISYGSPYSKNHPVIEMLFDILAGWDSENLAKLLLFITGNSQVPVNGFKDYSDRGKPIRISSVSDKNRLCVAHTCFNTLDLPQYDDYDDMEMKLLLSIQETEFGLG